MWNIISLLQNILSEVLLILCPFAVVEKELVLILVYVSQCQLEQS